MVDQGDRTVGARDEAVDLAEPCGAARVHHHRVLDFLCAGLSQLELGKVELRVGQEAAYCRLLRAREEDPRIGEEPHRAHRRRESVEVGREMGGNDLHALIVLNSLPASPSPSPFPCPGSGEALPNSTRPVSQCAAARGCQARRHHVEDNVMSGCQAPPVNATAPRRQRLPGGGFKLGGAKSEIRNPKSPAYLTGCFTRAANDSYLSRLRR